MRVKGFSEDNFWAKVDKSGDCWEWTACKTNGGYGLIKVHGRKTVAHRVAYELSVGPIPEGLELDHICGSRGCVRPAHLRQATRKQNNENRAGAQAGSRSGVRGVLWDSEQRKWRGSVSHNNKRHYLGRFNTIAEAEAVVVAKRLELYTHNEMDRKAA